MASAGSVRSSSAQKAFAIQYISLMLIVLTVLIMAWQCSGGSFRTGPLPLSNGLNVASSGTDKPPHAGIARQPQLGVMRLDQFFTLQSTDFDHDLASAWLTLLRSHDVIAEIEVRVSDSDRQTPASHPLSLGLARVATLYRFLTEGGVPAYAVKVATVESSVPWQVRVRFAREVR